MLENPRIGYIGFETLRGRAYLIDKQPNTPGRGIKEVSTIYPDGHPTTIELRDRAIELSRTREVAYGVSNLDHLSLVEAVRRSRRIGTDAGEVIKKVAITEMLVDSIRP